ncbi:hypothetical protein NP493_351g03039 [Ridgeia piscesae]|uniref:Uncharacterized protein n=1 Tax=Ridgeia piscesae TaxID=27915 RepID=A0AAD9L4W8_RIDPI|nr:hypothetical protein NP493_351g03039 [Ridgeia piscesae]
MLSVPFWDVVFSSRIPLTFLLSWRPTVPQMF